MGSRDIKEVLRRNSAGLLAKSGVVAVGIGRKRVRGKPTGELAIVCSVRRKQAKSELKPYDIIPSSLEEEITDVIETGVIRALASAPTDKWRPAPGGVSIGHHAITAGTLGCVVKKDGKTLVLSNNHVLANSNAAVRGDAILQPGSFDGGDLSTDVIGKLGNFVPITFIGDESDSDCWFANLVIDIFNAGCRLIGSKTRYRAVRPAALQAVDNLVDAALMEPLSETDVLDDQLGIGQITGTAEAHVGMSVIKSGRTTGVTKGTVLQTDVTTQVQYGAGKVALFSDQLMMGPMSEGGDSGSAVLDTSRNFVGLLFAGSDSVTICNRAANVLSALGITR